MRAGTYADLRAAIDAAEAAGLPLPLVDIAWHSTSDEDAVRIVRAFPDAEWNTLASSTTEWLTARVGQANVTAFLKSPEARPAERGKSLLAAAKSEAPIGGAS